MNKQNPFDFGQLLPGFNFLGGTPSASAASALGGGPLGHWIAPTVDVEELERRISELKAVQYWLEQNQLGVKATIQALEVQKMTLATLRGMNLNVAEVAKAFTVPTGAAATKAAAPARAAATAKGATADPSGKPMLDPMQWWGALSQQFQQIATQTLQEATRAAEAAQADAAAAVKTATEHVAGQSAAATAAAARTPAAPAKRTAVAKTPARRGAAARKKPAARGKK